MSNFFSPGLSSECNRFILTVTLFSSESFPYFIAIEPIVNVLCTEGYLRSGAQEERNEHEPSMISISRTAEGWPGSLCH